jgi:hypothetical protein
MFTTFEEGKKFIDDVKAFAQSNFYVISPVSFVRHLWGYYTDIKPLIGNMNRRGPNSIIQGLSSNLAYMSGRIFQVIINEARKNGIELDSYMNKMVHDSLEVEIRDIVILPIILYYLEHALTTLVAKRCKNIFNFSIYINLEAEFSLGPNLSSIIKYDNTERSLVKIVENALDFHISKGLKVNKAKLIKDVIKVNSRVNEYRLKELRIRHNFRPEKSVLLTPDKLGKILEGINYGK